MKYLYDKVKKLTGKYSKPERPVRDKEHKPVIEIQEQRNSWVKHREELLNRPVPLNPLHIEAAHIDIPINFTLPTIEEIRIAIRQIKYAKSKGPDNIPTEALKSDLEVTAKILHISFSNVEEEEQVPLTDWKKEYLIKIPKKGDLNKCENYRGHTLLLVPGNVFNRVLLNWVKDPVDVKISDQQTRFLKDRSCTVRIATLQIIVKQSIGRS
ncbi:unnamed protein product [Schistosoma curassoni]|uniref:Reverse transcriptase domain-containing protein n=1 Tax=Schistosoma curassoni TaxID=6186 RepID=A0A183K2R7_9TREM|nr:unnamed protein product [Schistosoma curassoni]